MSLELGVFNISLFERDFNLSLVTTDMTYPQY